MFKYHWQSHLEYEFTCFLYLQLRLARLSKPIVCLTIISTLVAPSHRWDHVPERGRDVPGFEGRIFMAVLFCCQNFHHSIFLSSDYLLENIFSDGDLFFVIRLFTRKIFGDLPSWPSPLHRVHSRFWVHLFKNCERKDIQKQKELKNRKYKSRLPKIWNICVFFWKN